MGVVAGSRLRGSLVGRVRFGRGHWVDAAGRACDRAVSEMGPSDVGADICLVVGGYSSGGFARSPRRLVEWASIPGSFAASLGLLSSMCLGRADLGWGVIMVKRSGRWLLVAEDSAEDSWVIDEPAGAW